MTRRDGGAKRMPALKMCFSLFCDSPFLPVSVCVFGLIFFFLMFKKNRKYLNKLFAMMIRHRWREQLTGFVFFFVCADFPRSNKIQVLNKSV